jgi:hypothetical protein
MVGGPSFRLAASFGPNAAQKYEYSPVERHQNDLLLFISRVAKPLIQRQVSKAIAKAADRAVKFHAELQLRFSKLVPSTNEDGKTEYTEHTAEPWFKSTMQNVFSGNPLMSETELQSHFGNIMEKVDLFHHEGSGWVFEKILSLRLYIVVYMPFSGGGRTPRAYCCLLPEKIRHKKACINPPKHNLGDTCFRDCLLMAEHRAGGGTLQFLSRRKIEKWHAKSQFDFSGLSFPTPITQAQTFERHNPGVALSIFAPSNSKRVKAPCIRVLFMSKNFQAKPSESACVDLLLWGNHYFLINSLSRLLGRAAKRKTKYVCRSCFCTFPTEMRRKSHWTSCCSQKAQLFRVPSKHVVTRFEQYDKMITNRFVVYYDFETMQVPCKDEPSRRRHVPIAVAAIRICHAAPQFNSDLFSYMGLDCVEQFLSWLDQQVDECLLIKATHNRPLRMTSDDWKFFNQQKHCQMCGVPFQELCPPCKDHCHLSGKFRFSLCNRCNFTYASEKSISIPCFAHGAVHFDQHLLINALVAKNKREKKPPPRILPRNTEHYLAIFNGAITFLDSYEFLKSSLSSVVESMKNKESSLSTTGNQAISFPLLWQFADGSSKKYELLCRKGVFCYDYLDGVEKTKERWLPTRKQFYDSLHEKHVDQADYMHAQRVWSTFSCQNLGDYLMIYLLTDVLLLADCFEKFRKLSQNHFQLDVAKFLTLPHFSFHAMLKKTGVALDVIGDIEMVQWLKGGIRGGVASIMKRYAEANVPEMGAEYKPFQPRREIVVLDCTNLYGHALSKSLPEKEFRFLSREEINALDVEAVPDDSPIGYILAVDLTYPAELHTLHGMYPLAPQKIVVPPAQWSNYTYKLARDLGEPGLFKVGQEKLVPDLTDRRNYVLHYQNLKFYLGKGMKLLRIRRAVMFKQRPWMRDFVEFITAKRQQSVSDFESSFWKLNLNSIYGRLLMDKSKHVNMRLVDQVKTFQRYAAKPNFKSVTFYNRDFVGVQMKPESIELRNPVAVGFTVLELSKLHMAKFHYNFVLPSLRNCQLLMTDTDSLAYLVENDDPKQIFSTAAKKYFDFSNFPKNHTLYDLGNKKIKGTFKIEYPAQCISKFIGIRAKMYCFQFQDEVSLPKAKGVPRMALDKLRFQDYYRALFQPEHRQTCQFRAIRSQKHQLFTLGGEKKSLCCFDLKRWVCDNGIDTLAYGDFRCERQPPSMSWETSEYEDDDSDCANELGKR